MKLIVISAAFCPSSQLARMLIEYEKTMSIEPAKHIIVDCHYPIDKKRNQRDLRLIVDSYQKAILMDPGKDLGSAQSQNWVLDELADEMGEDDVFLNLDPDAACRTPGWDLAMLSVLKADPTCVLVSCNAPMIDKFKESRHQEMGEAVVGGQNVLLPDMPTPFNLSMWRASFFRGIGGIPQKFPMYGEVEGPVYAYARAAGFYNCYLKDYYENEDGKLMHDPEFEEWKNKHARTSGPESFLGSFEEYCLTKGLIKNETH